MDFKSIPIGKTKKGRTVRLHPDTRKLHMHVIGASGRGKSKFIEHLIRQDIINNNGLCLIDPHGYLYNDLVKWCTEKGMLDRGRLNKKIILFDPSDAKWTFGFNPLPSDEQDMLYYVGEMVKAVAKVWGAENTLETPTLERCLRRVFHCLAQKKLSLLEAQYLISSAPSKAPVKKYLVQGLIEGMTKDDWEYFKTLKAQPFEDRFLSTINRLGRFIEDPAIRTIVGQTERTLDVRKIMDEGYILLVNLGTAKEHWERGRRISRDELRLLGTLLVNEFFLRAIERPPKSRPFYLYIDECSLFLNKDIEHILTECRKFGLHLVLAHQTIGQLKEAGEAICQGVMSGAQTKVVFGGLSAKEAKEMAEEIFFGEFNLEEPKKILTKPVVVGYDKTKLESYARGRTTSWGTSRGESQSTGQSSGQTANWAEGEARQVSQQFLGEDIITTSVSQGGGTASVSSQQSGSSYGESESESESESWGVAEALIPILEERAGGVHTLEEVIYKASAFLKAQKTQCAIIKIPEEDTEVVKTPTVKDGYARPARIKRFKEKCYDLADYASPRALIEAQIKERQRLLIEQAREASEPKEPESYAEEEKTDDRPSKPEENTTRAEPDSEREPEPEEDSLKQTTQNLWGKL